VFGAGSLTMCRVQGRRLQGRKAKHAQIFGALCTRSGLYESVAAVEWRSVCRVPYRRTRLHARMGAQNAAPALPPGQTRSGGT
jgi:hypothetical protein